MCFGVSLVFHAAVLLSLILSPVPPASPWSAKTNPMPEGERQIVQVTFMMSMTDFAIQSAHSKPSDVVAPPSDTAPSEISKQPNQPPIVADPQPLDQPIAQEPTPPRETPIKPDNTAVELATQITTPRPIVKPDELLAPLPEPVALLDAPKPVSPPIAISDPPNDLFEPTLLDITEQLDSRRAQTEDATPSVTAQDVPSVQDNPTAESVADAAAQAKPENEKPTDQPNPQETETLAAEPAESSDTPPQITETDKATEDDKPPAVVYDEESVDQPIAFDKMARPKQSAVSKRLGERGTIRILVEVDELGRLVRHTIIDDAGHTRLLTAAIAALEDSTFLPAEHAGQPVRSTRVIEYRF